MTDKRFTIEIIEDKDVFIQQKGANHYLGVNGYVNGGMVVDLLNELDRLAEANEEQGLEIMTYLHDNYYDIWEEVNKELFKE